MNTIDLVSLGITLMILVFLAAQAAVDAKSIKRTSRFSSKRIKIKK